MLAFGKYHRMPPEKETKKKGRCLGDKIYLITREKESILERNTHKKKVQCIVKQLKKTKSKCRLEQTNKIFYARHRE